MTEEDSKFHRFSVFVYLASERASRAATTTSTF